MNSPRHEKLIEIVKGVASTYEPEIEAPSLSINEAIQQIEELYKQHFLALVGEDEKERDMSYEPMHKFDEAPTRNKLRAEIRERLESI